MSHRLAAMVAACLLFGACADDTALLAVDLLTDLNAGQEFDAVTVRLLDGDRVIREAESEAGRGDYRAGVRVADFGAVALGDYALSVVVSLAGREVQRQRILVTVEGNFVARVLMTRDCQGKVCPVDDAVATACLGGRCVNPTCVEAEGAGACEPECTADEDCATDEPCIVSSCVSGICFDRGQCLGGHATCGDGLVELDEECEPADGSSDCDPDCTQQTCEAGCDCLVEGGTRYMVCSARRTWVDAVAACAAHGMGLLSIDTPEENRWLTDAITSRGIARTWTSGQDRLQEASFSWWSTSEPFWRGGIGGSPVDGAFAPFHRVQPDNIFGFQDCVATADAPADESGLPWDDERCLSELPFVCETLASPNAPVLMADVVEDEAVLRWVPARPWANIDRLELCRSADGMHCLSVPAAQRGMRWETPQGPATFFLRAESAAGVGIASTAITLPIGGVWSSLSADAAEGRAVTMIPMHVETVNGAAYLTPDPEAVDREESRYLTLQIRSIVAEAIKNWSEPSALRVIVRDEGTSGVVLEGPFFRSTRPRADSGEDVVLEWPLDDVDLFAVDSSLDPPLRGNLRLSSEAEGEPLYVRSLEIVTAY